MISKKQLKLLRYLYRKPRTFLWIKNKFKVSNLRDIASGMFTLIHATDGHYQDDCIISLSREGIIEVEQHQWFDLKFFLLQIVLPIVIAVITTLITIFLTTLLSPSL